jgi:deoxyribonucleoside regulator
MTKYKRGDDREELLADVAVMYYEEGLTQAEISRSIKVTRSAISRMLTEARQRGIVEIQVRRPLRFDPVLEKTLIQRFNLQSVHVLAWERVRREEELKNMLGKAGAQVLAGLLAPNMTVGVAWGTTVNATIDALEVTKRFPIKVVQLVGVLGSSSHAFNPQALVEKMAHKLGGEGVYLYTPFIVENEDMVRSLLNVPTVQEAINIGRQCQLALVGIGTTVPEFCSLYQGGHISRMDLDNLIHSGAVGDVSGHYFDIHGQTPDNGFESRLVCITKDDLVKISTRVAVAGGASKAAAILGALRGKYINVLVTDSTTAEQVLELDGA